MKEKITYVLLAIILVISYSCEYNSDEMNYHKLTPPEENATLTFNLADFPEGNMIYIYTSTNLIYDLNVSSGTIIEKQFFIDDVQINNTNNSIYLTPYNLSEGTTSTLKVKIKTTSNTGSLAELLGYENQEFELIYPIKYVNPNFDITVNQRLSLDGFLEIYWNKPNVEGASIEKYEVYSTIKGKEVLLKTIYEANENSFKDIDYVYGEKFYRIVAYINANSDIYKSESYYSVDYIQITNKNIDIELIEGGKLQLAINNPNPYKAKYQIKKDDKLIENKENSNIILFDRRPAFPMNSHLEGTQGSENYMIYIAPTSYKAQNISDLMTYFIISYEEIQLEPYYESINDRRIFKSTSFSKENNAVLFFNHTFNSNELDKYYLTTYDLLSNKIEKDIVIPNLTDRRGFLFDTYLFKEVGSPKILVSSQYYGNNSSINNIAYIYSSIDLNQLINTIRLGQKEYIISFTTNDLLLTEKDNLYFLYDGLTGKQLKTWDLGNASNCKLSPCGNYLVYSDDQNKYSFYQIDENYNLSLRYSGRSPLNLKEIDFHPLNSNIAYVTHMNDDTYALNSDLINLETSSIIKKIDKGIRSIDPSTGKICLIDNNYSDYMIYILDESLSNELYTLNSSSGTMQLKLYNNFLVESCNSILDISKAIK